MAQRLPPDRYRWWVNFGLTAVGGRTGMWSWLGLSLVSAIACLAYGFWTGERIVAIIGGPGFVIAALMYGLTIRWVDRHGSWAGRG